MTIHKINIDYRKYIDGMEEKDFVIIDPPWNYDNKSKEFTSKTEFEKVLNNVEMLNYLFANIKTKVLLLWITSPLLGYILDKKTNVDTKDFSYKQMLVWEKCTNNGNDYPGSGFWFKNSCEFLVLFTKKNAKPIRSRILNICREKATRNSQTQKPKIFESFIFREFYNSGYIKGAYIFSGSFIGYDISNNQEIDCVDICFNDYELNTIENVEKTK